MRLEPARDDDDVVEDAEAAGAVALGVVQAAAGVEGVVGGAVQDQPRAEQRAADAEARAIEDARVGGRVAVVEEARALGVAPLDERDVLGRVDAQQFGDRRRLLALDAQAVGEEAERFEELVAFAVARPGILHARKPALVVAGVVN